MSDDIFSALDDFLFSIDTDLALILSIGNRGFQVEQPTFSFLLPT